MGIPSILTFYRLSSKSVRQARWGWKRECQCGNKRGLENAHKGIPWWTMIMCRIMFRGQIYLQANHDGLSKVSIKIGLDSRGAAQVNMPKDNTVI